MKLTREIRQGVKTKVDAVVWQRHMRDEVEQETLISLWKHDEPDPERGTNGLIGAIVRRRYADVFRGSLTQEHTFTFTDSAIKFDADTLEAKSNLSDTEYEESMSVVRRVIDQLPVWMRQCAMDVLVKGYTHREVSEKLNIPTGTVLSRVSRAKAKLRTLLKGHVAC